MVPTWAIASSCMIINEGIPSSPTKCKVDLDFGAGGRAFTIKAQGKSYTYEESLDPTAENPADAKVVHQTLNDKEAKGYARNTNNTIIKLVANSDNTPKNTFLCVKQVKGKLEVCFK